MNYNLKKSLKQYGAIFEEAQSLIPATIGTADEFGQVDVPGKENYVYVRIQSGEIAQAYNTKVVALAGLRVWCGYEKLRPGLLQVLDVRNVYGKEYQQRIPAHAKTHEYGGYDQVFVRGEQFIPKLVSKFSGMVVRVQAGAIYTDDFGWNWHNPQELNMTPYVPTTGAHWAMIEVTNSGTMLVTVGATVAAKELLFATSLPNPHNAAQPLAAIAMYSNQSGINASKYGTSDIFDLRWHQSIKTGTAGGGGIPEAPSDGEAYGRKNGTWVIVSGSAGMSEAPMDGLQYGRQSGSWTEVSGTGGGGLPDAPLDGYVYGRASGSWVQASGTVLTPASSVVLENTFGLSSAVGSSLLYARQDHTHGSPPSGVLEAPMDGLQYARQSGTWKYVTGSGATAYLQLTDVRITGTMTNGNSPVWIAASGAWYPMPTWEDMKDPTGWIYPDDIVSYYDNSARTIYLSGTLQYYWHGIKRTLGDGVSWTSSAHSGTDYSTYYLYSNDGTTFDWKSTPWVFDNIMVALVKRRGSVMFGTREHHGLMPWQVHEALHNSISSFLKSGGTPIAGSYSTSASDASTRPIFAAALIEDEDLESAIPQTTSGTYTTLRVSGTTAIFQAGQSFPFRATGSFMLINNPTTGAETPTSHNQFQNIYQIMTPMTADVESQKYTTVFLQPQRTFTSQTAAESEIVETLQLGDFKSLFAESVMYTRICYNTRNANSNAGKCSIASITYVSKYGAGAGASAVPPADYVLSGTNYDMPASVGVATEYARADHLHGTPPSGTGGSSTTTVNNVFSDIRINQTSGTSVYPNLIGNQNTSNLYYTVSDGMYTSGKLLVFLNGQALSQGKDWSEQHPASGTFFFISGSAIPTSTDIITAQYTISGTLAVADAPMTGLNYNRNSGSWVAEIDYFSVEAQIGDTVNVVTSGTTGYLEVPVGANIESYRIMSGISGSISVDVMKSTYASAPPTVSICSGTYVTLTNDFKNENTNLNGWTKNIIAGDWVGFKVLTAPALVKQVTVSLNCRKS